MSNDKHQATYGPGPESQPVGDYSRTPERDHVPLRDVLPGYDRPTVGIFPAPRPFGNLPMKYAAVSYRVMDELMKAHAKFPDQHLPWGGGPRKLLIGVAASTMEECAETQKIVVDRAREKGTGDWLGVIAEEFFEAGAEEHMPTAITELVQVAAMCFRAIVDMEQEMERRDRSHVHVNMRPTRPEDVMGTATLHDLDVTVPRGPAQPGDLGYKGEHPIDRALRAPDGAPWYAHNDGPCGPECGHAPDGGNHPINPPGDAT
jgi:hypothetical protein